MKKQLFAIVLSLCILTYNSITCFATQNIDVETSQIPNWPVGPNINAGAAFLFEANTGVILYAKNIHDKMYPASTTKLMTALLAAENSKMSETVKFSSTAVFSLEEGSSNIGIDPGQSMPMEECLYGIMVASANEVANAVAEHVGGSIPQFVDMMNEKVRELGLVDTHFTNANGLFDEQHYTSCYDLAIIAREFFKNDRLSKIGNTGNYHFQATANQPDDFYIKNKHKLINGDIPYSGIKGGKTGYTSQAKESLVTCAENDGMKLICVVMKEEAPDQFTDTVKLFDYGFSNFQVTNIADNDNRYAIKSSNFFPTSVDVLGNSDQILELNPNNYIIMPRNITFKDLETSIDYGTDFADEVAYIEYSYHGAYLGNGSVNLINNNLIKSAFDDSVSTEIEKVEKAEEKPIIINVIIVVKYITIITLILIVLSFIHYVFVNYNLFDNFKEKQTIKKRRRRDSGGVHL